MKIRLREGPFTFSGSHNSGTKNGDHHHNFEITIEVMTDSFVEHGLLADFGKWVARILENGHINDFPGCESGQLEHFLVALVPLIREHLGRTADVELTEIALSQTSMHGTAYPAPHVKIWRIVDQP